MDDPSENGPFFAGGSDHPAGSAHSGRAVVRGLKRGAATEGWDGGGGGDAGGGHGGGGNGGVGEGGGARKRMALSPPRNKGKWTVEEEAYASCIVQYFQQGLLVQPEGKSLRSLMGESRAARLRAAPTASHQPGGIGTTHRHGALPLSRQRGLALSTLAVHFHPLAVATHLRRALPPALSREAWV